MTVNAECDLNLTPYDDGTTPPSLRRCSHLLLRLGNSFPSSSALKGVRISVHLFVIGKLAHDHCATTLPLALWQNFAYFIHGQ